MSVLVSNTPLERYELGGRAVWVKREDLCAPYPGPQFSKIRGVEAHLAKRPEGLVGVLDTFHSKAGWAVAYICKHQGKRCLNFWPKYKADGDDLRPQQIEAGRNGAMLTSLPAGRSAILFHIAKRSLPAGGYMMPNALKLLESVDETAREFGRTVCPHPDLDWSGRQEWIVPISSGTIAAGVIAGIVREGMVKNARVWLHMGYSRTESAVGRYVAGKVAAALGDNVDIQNGMESGGVSEVELVMIDEGFNYKDKVAADCPFPANPYYDLKTWLWLGRNMSRMKGQVLFWNIGA
jgi:hypothetical protein